MGSDADGLNVTLERVTKSYRTQRGETVLAVDRTDLNITSREFVCVVGPSGCGKTTLLKMLAGFQAPTTGTISVNGKPIHGPSPERGVVFQQPTLYPWLTVRGNVEFGLRMRHTPKELRGQLADQALDMVGLSGEGEFKPYELSGGMQQRAQIARVLVNNPEIILMDEPYGALDALTREHLQNELLQIWQSQKKTVFFITHSVEEAVFLGTRVLVMSARPGRVIMDIPVHIAADTGGTPGADIRSAEEFIALRDKITDAIYSTQEAATTSDRN